MGADGVSKSIGGAFGCSEWEDFSAVGAKASERGASLWGDEAVVTVGVSWLAGENVLGASWVGAATDAQGAGKFATGRKRVCSAVFDMDDDEGMSIETNAAPPLEYGHRFARLGRVGRL